MFYVIKHKHKLSTYSLSNLESRKILERDSAEKNDIDILTAISIKEKKKKTTKLKYEAFVYLEKGLEMELCKVKVKWKSLI